jgi:UDP-N-acetylmuramyl pentapeptide phosphotransferase/UDP-N-acetylglucosamine-1-phosphate transferase
MDFGDGAVFVIAMLVALPLATAISALITVLSIRYARHRGMLDQPGQRRSHTIATPRGGGIGIVVVACMACSVELMGGQPVALLAAIVLVAAAGWIDDHRGLGAVPRLLLHLAATGIFLTSLPHQTNMPWPWLLGGFGLALLGVVWSINLHNFMDGINGILAWQAIFALSALSVLCAQRLESTTHAVVLLLTASATLGFLPFNFPRARVFMGDVGSGVLGLLIGIGVLWQMTVRETAVFSGLIVCSAFVTDTTCTLLSRMSSGRRWYSAHREHLYQWMTRTGMSHARVVAWYMGWNLLVAAPVLYLANREDAPGFGLFWAIAIYALAAIVWFIGKRWCLYKVKMR